MKDSTCVEFLQWCLPRLKLRWEGFRKVRKQVCKRIGRRMGELDLSDASEYKEYLETHADEWTLLDEMCRITISRFYRDRRIYDFLRTEIFPKLMEVAGAEGKRVIRCWSAGCASGEEAYTLKLIWNTFVDSKSPLGFEMEITATDAMETMLERGREGNYLQSSLKDLPEEMVRFAFDRRGGSYSLRDRFKQGVNFIRQDIRREAPAGMFHLAMCRNLVFTYFDVTVQEDVLYAVEQRLVRGGFLVIGVHEKLPKQMDALSPIERCPCIFEKIH